MHVGRSKGLRRISHPLRRNTVDRSASGKGSSPTAASTSTWRSSVTSSLSTAWDTVTPTRSSGGRSRETLQPPNPVARGRRPAPRKGEPLFGLSGRPGDGAPGEVLGRPPGLAERLRRRGGTAPDVAGHHDGGVPRQLVEPLAQLPERDVDADRVG